MVLTIPRLCDCPMVDLTPGLCFVASIQRRLGPQWEPFENVCTKGENQLDITMHKEQEHLRKLTIPYVSMVKSSSRSRRRSLVARHIVACSRNLAYSEQSPTVREHLGHDQTEVGGLVRIVSHAKPPTAAGAPARARHARHPGPAGRRGLAPCLSLV